jgi:hypothetical protein
MLGVDMDKLFKEQEKKLRQSAEREQLIREGVMSEHDDVQPTLRGNAGLAVSVGRHSFTAAKRRGA